ncbi:MAG: polyamine ABC transporter ATP-binding protein [Verrucomicrobia bacterium GWC2_42_7]|nr:MAG: polyamine ABC transporter ATP-binding protein [Verrucomicrobia bacterium GWC2_42_7]
MNITQPPLLEVRNLSMGYDLSVVLKDVNFSVSQGEIFVVMGGSGCGKSTLQKHLIGLQQPMEGDVFYHGQSLTLSDPHTRQQLLQRMGVLFQGGALWSFLTLLENVSLPLSEHTLLKKSEIRELATLKLALVGLSGFEHFYPSEISGGMKKRAGLARAMALDPEILFFDEPSSGLDPLTSQKLDDLILQIRESLGTTIVVVTHELASIFAIADRAIFLDSVTKTVLAEGNPHDLLQNSNQSRVKQFLSRGKIGCA